MGSKDYTVTVVGQLDVSRLELISCSQKFALTDALLIDSYDIAQ